MDKKLIKIAIPGTPRILFTYQLPDRYEIKLTPGQRLLVPLGHRRMIGFYMGPAKKEPASKLKSIIEIIDSENLFNPESSDFLQWMADYYYANPADVFNAALPPRLRKRKKPTILTKISYSAIIRE